VNQNGGQARGTLRDIARRLKAARAMIVSRWYETQFAPARLEQWRIAGVEGLTRAELEGAFVGPLLDLLIEYLESGNHEVASVYLDERLRYAPHQAAPEARARFFAELLPLDDGALLDALDQDASRRAAYQQLSAGLHAPLLLGQPGPVVRMLALGDCVMGDLRVFLPDACRAHGLGLDMRCMYFSGLVGRELSTAEVKDYLAVNPTDVIALSFLTYEGIPPYGLLLREADQLSEDELQKRIDAVVGAMRRFVEDLRASTDAPFLIHNVSGLPLTRWRKHLPVLPPLSRGVQRVVNGLNTAIGELVEGTPNCVLVDEAALVRKEGHREASRGVVPRRISKRAYLHTSRLGGMLAPFYADVLRAYETMRKAKVLLLDFDNTLWDGVMGEGAVTHHHDRQALLRKLRESGMLLVALSKNDSSAIRWDEMTLKPEDFVVQKISWNTKVQSIQEVAQQLDLGVDSFVLLDDNPVERDLVSSQLPKVRTLDSTDASAWWAVDLLQRFPNTKATEESRRRTEIYREQALRREALASDVDYPAMMASLGLKVRFGPARQKDLDRVTELVQRTNQFNTTTVRYPKAQLHQLMADPARRVYVAQLDDKFGSIGLVAVAIMTVNGAEAVFDSFIMSCRAMGFRLEHAMVRLAMDTLPDVQRFTGLFVPTDRNSPSAGLWKDCGFAPSDPEGTWTARRDSVPAVPGWLAVLER
jgi:FkbH-like protein